MEFKCQHCEMSYKSNSGLWKHNLKHHNQNIVKPHKNDLKEKKKYYCRKCNKSLSDRNSRWRHEKTCKVVSQLTLENKIQKLETKIQNLTNKTEQTDKTKQIEQIQQGKLLNLPEQNHALNSNIKIDYTIAKFNELNIITRKPDNYIDGIFMCGKFDKNFEEWFNLSTTTSLLCELSKIKKMPISDLFQRDKPFVWLSHELVFHLAYWLSPIYATCINVWVSGLDGKDDIIKNQNNKIKLFENQNIKKQKRTEYPEKNVIYVLTTEYYKNKNTYIIGEATNLTSRLSTYNKTAEHEVIYYKSCNNPELLGSAEKIILSKLDEFREQANRDRFILPENLDVSYIVNTINDVLNYLNKPKQQAEAKI